MDDRTRNDNDAATSGTATGRDVASRYWWGSLLPVAVCLAATVIAIAFGLGF